MSEISKLIDRVADDALVEPLKAAGYRKDGRTWRRTIGEAIQVVNVQGSKHSGGPDGRFFLNVGVYFRALAERVALFPPTDKPHEHDCHLRKRAEPPGHSYWEVRLAGVAKPDTDAGIWLGGVFSWLDRRADRRAPELNARATASLRDALEKRGLPWLDRLADLRSARDELVRLGQIRDAVAASLELGERDEALRLFRRALTDQSAGRDDLEEWGRAQGLEL